MSENADDSIVVVTSLTLDSNSSGGDGQSIKIIRDGSSMASSSVVTINQENECFYLESELKRLKLQLNEFKSENSRLKHSLDQLITNNNASRNQPLTPESFIDVNEYSVAEKIEYHLAEADKLFKDETHFKLAMEYLVKNLWSTIAHQYNEKNLENLKLIRDSLLIKLDRSNELVNCGNNVGMLETEFEAFKKDTYSLKDKIVQQNQIIKSLLESMPNSLTTSVQSQSPIETSEKNIEASQSVVIEQKTETEPTQIENTNKTRDINVNAENSEDDSDDSDVASPNISPSASFANHLSKFMNGNRIAKNGSLEPNSLEANANTNDDETLKHEQPQNTISSSSITTSNATTSNSMAIPSYPHPNTTTTTPNSASNITQPNDFCLYHVNDGYIAVDHTGELGIEKIGSEQSRPKPPPSGIEAMGSFVKKVEGSNFVIYQCPKCNTSIDPQQIAYEVFLKHMQNCDVERNLVCMFCLRSFTKEDEDDYVDHVNSHMIDSF